MEWQPIETAPKNDAGECYGPAILIWNDAAQLPFACFWGASEGNWIDAEGTNMVPHRINDITHWMPLPEPPKETT